MAKKVIKKPSIQDILNGGKSRSIDISNYNNYEPNDNTQVNNVVRKKYNTNRDKYLEPAYKIGGYRALKTTAGKIGTALGAVPIAVAGVPALGTVGEVAAPTVAKVAGSLVGKLLGAGLTSAGLASGINDVSKGEYHWYTPLDLAPGVGMALNGANKTIKAYNTIKNIKQEENINRLNLFRKNEKIGNLSGKIRGTNDDLQSKVYRLQDNFRYGKNKYFAEAIAKKNKKLDKINDEIIARENMPEDNFHDLVDKYDNYKYQRFKYLYNKRSRKYDSADPDGFLESPFTTDRYRKAPDLRKTSVENVRKFMNEHGLSAKYFEVTTDEFGRPFIKLNNNGDGAFTTGDISLTDFTTGKKYQFNIPNNTTDYGIIKPNFNYFGNNSSLHTEPWSLTNFNNGGIKKVDIPQQYKDVLQRNMEFLKNQYLDGNAKGFGSVNSVIYHDLPHGTHDYDFITTSDRFKNIQGKRIKNNGGYKRQIQSDEYGPLDVNVIDVGENGGAKNELAHEIYKELYPEKYKKFISEHINDKNVTDLELPISPEDLYQSYDEKNKSFIDMFLSNNPKHVGRFINQLNAGDTDDIVRGMEKYNEIMTGGDFKSSNIPLSEFEDPARNEEILRRLGLTNKNVLNENILSSPKKTKAIVDRIIVDKTYLGRGIHTRYSDDKVKDLLIWNPDTNGGTVYGAKLNTVQGGNSTHGDLYTFIRPKEFKNPKDIKSVNDIINFENYNVGIRTLNDNEIKLAQDIAKKHNVELDKPKTLQDLLDATRNKKGLNIKNYLEEISDKLDVPAIQNVYYEVAGNSDTAPNFVSVLRDQELPSIKQYFINNADRPTTLINKSNKVGGNSDYSDNALSLLNNTWEQTKYQSHINMKKLREAENNSVDDMQSLFRRKFGADYDKKIRIVNKRLDKELEDIKNVYEKEKAKPIRNIQMSKRVEKKIDNINGIIKNNNNRLLKLNNKINENNNNYSKYLVRSNNYRDELKNRITRNLLGSSYIGTALGIEYLSNKNSHKHMRNRKKYAVGGKVPPAAAPVRLQINPTNLPLPFTNNEPVMPLMKGWELRSKLMKERSIAEYQDWLNKADPQIINAVRKMKNTKEPLTPYLKAWTPEQKETLRQEYEIKKTNNSDETPYYEYGIKNDLIPGATCINTSTAAHGEAHPSNVDFAENYKKYGYKRVDVNEMQPGDIIQLSTGGVPTHAMMATSTFDPIYKTFKTSQSHGGHAPSQMEHGKIFTIDPYQAQIRAAREDIKKGKKVDIKSLENDTRELPANIYHYLTPEGIMLYRKIPTTNNKNTYKFGGKITNKQDAIASYKKPIPMDKIKYTPTIGVRIPTDSELRRQKEIESLTPNERYEYRRKEAANEKRNNEFKALLNGFNNTFGRAASLASLIYGGGWAANRLIRGNKSSALGQHLSKYMIPANTIDTYGDATQFITNPSLSNGVELGAGIVGKKYRDYGKKSRQLFELGTQGLNAYNSYKFGGDVKATPKRKHENNYIMKGTGTYVPRTPQEKVVVDLYNANYKSARRNMPREDALRQAHYRTTQQMMESGYGTSKQARKQNNYGGMGGSNSYNYKTINDFTDHVDTTMFKNFKNSYKAPTLKSYINGLYNGRIGAYSETPIEIYDKEFRGTHPRTSKIIEQLNPDDYSLNQLNINPYYNEMLNPYINYNRDIAKFGGCKRPKAFWGAVIGAGLSIASNLINKNAEKKAAKRQAAAEQLEQNRTAANNITTQLNEQMDNSDPYYAQFRTEFAKGGKVKGRKAVITDGGVAIPINKNMSLLRGSTHNEINESGNTGIGINFGGNQVEAQNGEIVRKKNGKLYIYSDEPMQNGISPAKRILNGENPDRVYNSQENYKRNHNIKTDKKYPYGGVASWLNKNFQGHQFTNGSLVNAGINLLGQGINFLINKNAVNKLKYTPTPIQTQAAKLNTTYNISPQIANLERNRMRTNEDITRNTSSSVAALNRRNYANLVANDQFNSIYNTKNEAEHKMINEDRMNEQNVRNNNIQQYNAWNAQRTEFENSKRLAKAQNYSNLVSGIGNTVSSTINEARKTYLDDQNLKVAAAPYGDGVVADLARNGVHADSLYVDRLRKLGKPKTPYDEALRTLYINSIQDPRLRYEFENDPEFAIPTPGNENYTIGRLNNINLGNINPIEQSMINNNNYLQSKFDNDWWTRTGKRQFRFPILNTYNNKSFIKVPYRV